MTTNTAARQFTVVCDGGAAPNPGRGGWAYLIAEGVLDAHALVPDHLVVEQCGAVPHATNNQMELQAAIEALNNPVLPDGAILVLMQDSQYVLKGLTEWMPGWKAKNWRTSAGKPVENKELWLKLDAARQRFAKLTPLWVRGHNGHPLNERVDDLVNQARAELG